MTQFAWGGWEFRRTSQGTCQHLQVLNYFKCQQNWNTLVEMQQISSQTYAVISGFLNYREHAAFHAGDGGLVKMLLPLRTLGEQIISSHWELQAHSEHSTDIADQEEVHWKAHPPILRKERGLHIFVLMVIFSGVKNHVWWQSKVLVCLVGELSSFPHCPHICGSSNDTICQVFPRSQSHAEQFPCTRTSLLMM